MNTTLPFRANVCILLVNKINQFFIAERYNEPGCWQFPQGGVEDGFSLEKNAIRETCEEIGVAAEYLVPIKQLITTYSYDWQIPPKYAVGKWRGQFQNFWLLRFTGEDSQIDLTKHDPQEFSRWRWCDFSDILNAVHPRRVEGYKPAIEEAIKLL